jgi:hypothetical protein
MFGFNPALDQPALRRELEETGIVVIRDALVTDQVSTLDQQLAALNQTWWTELMNVGGETLYKHNPALSGTVNDVERISALTRTRMGMEAGLFAYHFKDQRGHFETCPCVVCGFKRSLERNLTFFRTLTGDEELSVTEVFASLYQKGHFLSIHHDKKKRKYAFIFSFTSDWNPPWGGLLHVIRTCGHVHVGVSARGEIRGVAPKQRFALNGWLG